MNATEAVRLLKVERDHWQRMAESYTYTNPSCAAGYAEKVEAVETAIAAIEWKESMLKVESSWDSQGIAKLLGINLGEDIRANIEPKVRALIIDRDRGRHHHQSAQVVHLLPIGLQLRCRADRQQQCIFQPK